MKNLKPSLIINNFVLKQNTENLQKYFNNMPEYFLDDEKIDNILTNNLFNNSTKDLRKKVLTISTIDSQNLKSKRLIKYNKNNNTKINYIKLNKKKLKTKHNMKTHLKKFLKNIKI